MGILIYLFVYQNMSFAPGFLSSYYNIIAFFFSCINIFSILKNINKINKKTIKLLSIFLIIVMISIVSAILNNLSIFMKSPVRTLILIFFLDFNFIYFLLNKFKLKNKGTKFFKYYVYCTSLDLFFSIFRFLLPPIDIIFRRINIPKNYIILKHLEAKDRLIGLGGIFFDGGIILGISLILITYLLENNDLKRRERIIFKCLYFFNLVFGLIMSRTVVIGFIFSLFYLFLNSKNKIKIFFRIIAILLVLIISSFVFYLLLDKRTQSWVYKFIFITGKGSLETLIRYYNVGNIELKTLIIGDGLWGDAETGYYRRTDVGYLRTIFFNGLIGLSFQILFNYYFTRVKKYKLKKLSLVLFLYYLVLNLKGYVAYLPIALYIFLLGNTKKLPLIRKSEREEYGEYIN